MDIAQARKIIEALASGINPITGEVFENDHCFNEPDIIRALHIAKDQLIKVENMSTHKRRENAGKPWTPEEDEELKAMCTEGKSIKEIAYYFKRSHGSIRSRISLLTTY